MAEGVDLDRVTDEVDEVVGKAGERAAACAREMGRPGTGEFPADLADGFGVDPWFEERMSAGHARRSV